MGRTKTGTGLLALMILAPLLWAGCAKNSSDPVIVNPSRDELAAKNGFIAGNQRIKELEAGRHPIISCLDCHADAMGGPINNDCEDCHAAQAQNFNHPSLARCVDCHMPYATELASAATPYRADVRTHVLSIRSTPTRKGSMLEEDTGLPIVDVGPGLTLDFTCYGCHKDENGVGGNYSQKTLRQLVDKVPYIHAGSAARVGEEGR